MMLLSLQQGDGGAKKIRNTIIVYNPYELLMKKVQHGRSYQRPIA